MFSCSNEFFIRVVGEESKKHKYCDNFYGSLNEILFPPPVHIHQNAYSTPDVGGYENVQTNFLISNEKKYFFL